MQKTVLTIFVTALLAGSMIGTATAGERHHARKIYPPAPVVSEPWSPPYAYGVRDAYGWSYPDYSYWQSRLEGGVISAPAGH
ncbi:hypothetical protein [Bradyrhizobium sp. ARR65]|uniref:hypothetical protein n=1 Tax=Bradyrhizobium sp. ARR65 TaxID=1040989 RepID=UPI000AC071F5|nr:hypothetical protein [Bradyrhizobium sp. ARR65]